MLAEDWGDPAQLRAERLDAAAQLAEKIALEFSNLVTAILGYVDLSLLALEPGSRIHDDLLQAKDAASQASELARQLLAVCHQPAGGAGPGAAVRAGAPARRGTVLLVERREAERFLVARVLEDFGYRALASPDGPSALTMLAGGEDEVDLLLAAWDALGSDGGELAGQVRALRPRARVLLLGGDGASGTAPSALPEGASVLERPFTAHGLARKVAEVLGGA